MARLTAAPDKLEGYTQSKPRISTLPPIPCCDHCRRPSSNPHAPECPNSDGAPPVGWMATGGTLAEWVEEQKRRRAEPPVPSPVYGQEPEPDEDDRPTISCAECGQEMPNERGRKYCSPRCVRNNANRRMREARGSDPMTTATLAPGIALCKTCGPAPLANFLTRLDGTPRAICRPCNAAQAATARSKRPTPPIPQAVADGAYAAMTQAPDPEDMIPTKPVARFLPEPAVIDQAAPAPMPAEPFENLEQLPPIEDEIARAEQQLADLRDIRKLMEEDLPALLRWQRLVGEAITRKGGAA
jgi:hypothetical protein